jgi:UDP-glucose:(heptosyl)LPS alpha-1,3-glucosyltransferase
MVSEDDGIAVAFVANELHRKGLAQLLRAVANLGDARITINIVGKAPPTAYAPMIERLRLTGRVRYHGLTNDVGWWYSGADLLVLPTQYEPFGLVIVEALASGVPVITTRLAGASTAIRHGQTGLIQEDPLDVDELTSLLAHAVSTDLRSWGRTAAASVDGYRRDVVLGRVEEILLGP